MHNEIYEPYLEFCLLVAIFPIAAWLSYRAIAKLILKPIWTKWYVRRAIDVSFVGLLSLSWMSFAHEWALHFSPEQRILGDKLDKFRSAAYCSHSRYYEESEKLYQEYSDLSSLKDWQWFVDHFGQFVIFPTFAVLFIGYTVQSKK